MSDFKKKGKSGEFEDRLRRGVEIIEDTENHPEETAEAFEDVGTPVKAWRETVSEEELDEPLDDGFFDEDPLALWINEDRAERLGRRSETSGEQEPEREDWRSETEASRENAEESESCGNNLPGDDEVPDGESISARESIPCGEENIQDGEDTLYGEETSKPEEPLEDMSGEEKRGRSRARQSRKHREPKIRQEQSALDKPVEEPAKDAAKDVKFSQENVPEEKKKFDKKKVTMIAAAVIAAVLLAGGGAYAAMGQKYKKVFFPNTQINGLNVSGKSLDEVKSMITSGVEGYVLTIEERGGKSEQIVGKEIGLHPEFDGSLEEILATQNPYAWLSYQLDPASYSIDTMIVYDKNVFEEKVKQLECLDPSQMKEAEDARVSDYVQGQGFGVTPEVEGTVLKEEDLKRVLSEAIVNLKESISLEEAGIYKEPAVKQSDEALQAKVAELNQYANITITYRFGDKTEVLGGDRIRDWLIIDESGNVTVAPVQTAKYVEELAAAYNTSNKSKTFKTSYGSVIEVKGGTYGWKINQAQEAEELAAVILSGESQEREPVYSQKAASHGENDYGDSYVEINLTAQHLYLYKNGSLLVDSDFVSGNLSRGWGTPAGTYPLTYKQRNAVLKGENYRTPVDYWMPFNGGIGMHDATWRSSFGGTIYKTGGSHGCINLPHSVAKKIYENISGGMPVICYNLPGTEQKGSSSVTPTPVPTEAPAEIPTEAPVEVPSENPSEPLEPAPTEAPAPETTAPAGPGSDTNPAGGAFGPGSEIG